MPTARPSARPVLHAVHRAVTGKHVARLRTSGKLPAVVFGHGLPSANVSVDTHEFEQLRRHAGPNTLIDLSVDGGKAQPILVYGVQSHRVTGQPLHADLFVVRMTEELTVDVPLIPSGESEAVTMHGGTLLHVMEHIRVKALPDHLPQSVSYDISGLTSFESVVHVRDLVLPSDVTLLSDPDDILAKVAPPRVEEVEEVAPVAAAPVEGVEAGEAAAAPSEASTEA